MAENYQDESKFVAMFSFPVDKLWNSRNKENWKLALDAYGEMIFQARQKELDKELDNLDLSAVKRLDEAGWYEFLKDKFMPWKHTVGMFRSKLQRFLREDYSDRHALDGLFRIKKQLLAFSRDNILEGLNIITQVRGFAASSASALLAILFPEQFGTVDQFVVESLKHIPSLEKAAAVARIRSKDIKISDAVLVVGILRDKAEENNRDFETDFWTPRKIDKVLWTVSPRKDEKALNVQQSLLRRMNFPE